MTATLPYRLREGIYLEDCGTLLPWGTPRDQLAYLASPLAEQPPTSRRWTWQQRRAMGGLLVHVSASRFLDAINPRAYHLYLDHFHSVTVRLRGPDLPDDDALRREFRVIYDRLALEFDEGHWSYPLYNSGLPAIFWEFPPLQISFASLGRGYVAVNCSHEPSGYKELRDEASAFRAFRGARVDEVVW